MFFLWRACLTGLEDKSFSMTEVTSKIIVILSLLTKNPQVMREDASQPRRQVVQHDRSNK